MYNILIRFLRLFAPYRILEAEIKNLSNLLNETAAARAKAQDDVIYWRERAEELDRRLQQSHANEIEAREIVADFISQQRFGFGVFNRAPQLPRESLEVQPIPPARIQARRLTRERNREVLRQIAGNEG
jgi:septal ring factor EnvC (AmiA/AmiB activator)